MSEAEDTSKRPREEETAKEEGAIEGTLNLRRVGCVDNMHSPDFYAPRTSHQNNQS